MATWLYKKYVKWLGTKSFPETRKSTGYQKENSRFKVSNLSRGIEEAGAENEIKSFKNLEDWNLDFTYEISYYL